MRLTLLVLILVTLPALAATSPAKPGHPPGRSATEGPRVFGTFDDWTAATHVEGGQTICYAFTRAAASKPALPGRGDVVLTVTERAVARDAVAISAGFTYAANAIVILDIDQAKLDFYTAQRSAFARDGHAAVAALDHGRLAVATSPGPHNVQVSDAFSLRGFTAAYAAINKVCPAK
jgi:hypothetical protein